jgi:hypothetical protein
MQHKSQVRRSGYVMAVVAFAAAVALVSVPAAGTSGITNGLYAFVRSDSPGPVPACSGADCTSANTVWNFVYVANLNRLLEIPSGPRTRATLQNSFVVTSVDQTVSIDGIEQPGPPFTVTPPPDAFFRTYAGHWPSTVSCPGGNDPCNLVGSPAVIPGEVTSVVFTGWQHQTGEANGTHVFKYVVHGTLNGQPVSLTAFSRPIEMTD